MTERDFWLIVYISEYGWDNLDLLSCEFYINYIKYRFDYGKDKFL